MESLRCEMSSDHLLCARHCAECWGFCVNRALGAHHPGKVSQGNNCSTGALGDVWEELKEGFLEEAMTKQEHER